MDFYTPRKLRPWALTSLLLKRIIWLLRLAPLVFLCLVLFLSPLQPHLRIQYRYTMSGHTKIMSDCDYLGPRGFVKYMIGTSCPLLVMIDTSRRPNKRQFFIPFIGSIL